MEMSEGGNGTFAVHGGNLAVVELRLVLALKQIDSL